VRVVGAGAAGVGDFGAGGVGGVGAARWRRSLDRGHRAYAARCR